MSSPSPTVPSRCSSAARLSAQATAADVLATLDAWYESQLIVAGVAARESDDPGVRSYAQGLVANYGRYRDELTYLRSRSGHGLADQPQAQQVRAEGRAAVSRLQEVPEMDFDVAFVEAQAAQTRQFLRILAYDLLPVTTDPDLQTLLLQTKGTAKTDLSVLRGFQTRFGTLPTGI